MLSGDVDDGALAAEEPAGALAQGERVEEVGSLEDVEAPGGGRGRGARLGGLVVLEDDGGVGGRVGFRGEFARGGVVWFLFLRCCCF